MISYFEDTIKSYQIIPNHTKSYHIISCYVLTIVMYFLFPRMCIDLDGDLYFVCWDKEIVSNIPYDDKADCTSETTSCTSDTSETDEDSLIDTEFPVKENGKSFIATVLRKMDNDNYQVQVGNAKKQFSKDKIQDGHGLVADILGHRYSQIHILWDDKSKSWEPRSSLRDCIPIALAEYASENDLLDKKGWKWAQDHLRTPMKIINHGIENGSTIKVEILWNDGKTSWKKRSLIKDKDILAKYAIEHQLFDQAGWRWVKKFESDKKKNWFRNAQDLMVDPVRFSNLNTLTKKLHSLHKSEEVDKEDKIAYGIAYCQSLDIPKHGGFAELPFCLHHNIPRTLRKYISVPLPTDD